MTEISREDILSALSPLVEAARISGVAVREGKVGFLLTIDPREREAMEPVRQACEQAVAALPGVRSVTAVMTAQNAEPIPPSPQAGYTQPRERAVWNVTPVPGVKKIIAVASGKGGVGKSTTAVNLAAALARAGQRVGLLDADIHGPSVPRLMGLAAQGQPEIHDGQMQPVFAHGVACMSMGFITGDAAAVLRGPMISKTLHQLLRGTRWPELDVLLVDMPPGTGDVHLSLAQAAPLSGVILVTTPQQVALDDARKCLRMFEKLGVPVLGVVENMSGSIFGVGGGASLAREAGAPLLATVPLDAAVVQAGESGVPAEAAAYAEAIRVLLA